MAAQFIIQTEGSNNKTLPGVKGAMILNRKKMASFLHKIPWNPCFSFETYTISVNIPPPNPPPPPPPSENIA